MATVREILVSEIHRINQAEQRFDKIFFSPHFLVEKKGLYSLMCIMFIITLGLLIYSDIFSQLDVAICVILFVLLNGFFFFHINPSYNIDDIDKIAWKNCYTGEWYREVPVRQEVIDNILNSPQVNDNAKNKVSHLQKTRDEIYFYDLLHLE